MIKKTPIKDFYKRIVGWIEEDSITGNQVLFDFYNRKLGSYDKKSNITRDFYNRIIANGNMLISLLYTDNINK